MAAFMKYLVLVPLALVLALVAAANRTPVTFSLDPFARDAASVGFSAPLYIIVLGALAAGVALGGFAAWLTQGRYRRAARAHRRQLEKLQAETARLRDALEEKQPQQRRLAP
ncbi:LapA family protein [Camelimonas abortus]|uniref:LapA family protein n=1 Tax=Camelimonas abortus TaxID=1017184 RepID=A0ABV7LDL5_9HYPH